MTERLSMTQIGDQPVPLTCTVSPSTPIILGILGPQISVSMIPTVLSGFVAKACANRDVNVLFPTPPFPLSTRILCLTFSRRAEMIGISGSGPLGADAQMAWFGHPAHASALPACSESGPTQF